MSGIEAIPLSINATNAADYSADVPKPINPVNLNIIRDLIQDLDPGTDPEDRISNLLVSLSTPIPTVTRPAGTQADLTALSATTAITEIVPSVTPVLPTSAPTASPTIYVPPPPPPRPTKKKHPQPPTDTPTPVPFHLLILVPPNDGATISNTAETKFEAEAWDPGVGTNNGDGVTKVTFTIYDSAANAIYISTDDITPRYCAFGGDASCGNSASAGFSFPGPGTYTLEANVLSTANDTYTATRSFIIP